MKKAIRDMAPGTVFKRRGKLYAKKADDSLECIELDGFSDRRMIDHRCGNIGKCYSLYFWKQAEIIGRIGPDGRMEEVE
jgi:hypothetical protein